MIAADGDALQLLHAAHDKCPGLERDAQCRLAKSMHASPLACSVLRAHMSVSLTSHQQHTCST